MTNKKQNEGREMVSKILIGIYQLVLCAVEFIFSLRSNAKGNTTSDDEMLNDHKTLLESYATELTNMDSKQSGIHFLHF